MTNHDTTIREAREALSRLDKADEEIGEVAANVRSRWRMSIPANPNRDTDLIVSDACVAGQRAITALLAVIEQQQAIAEWLLAEQLWRRDLAWLWGVVVLADGEDAMTVRRRIARILDRGICRECGGTPESCRHSTVKCCPDCTHTADILNAGTTTSPELENR